MTGTANVAVVGVDFQPSSDDAIVTALELLGRGEVGKVHLVHVLDPRDVIDDPESPELTTELRVLEEAPSALLARARELARLYELGFEESRVVPHARIGRAVETLLQVTVDYEADLLLVGTHGRRGVERLLLGSVAEALVRSARCPVLIARPKSYAGLPKTERPDAHPTASAISP